MKLTRLSKSVPGDHKAHGGFVGEGKGALCQRPAFPPPPSRYPSAAYSIKINGPAITLIVFHCWGHLTLETGTHTVLGATGYNNPS